MPTEKQLYIEATAAMRNAESIEDYTAVISLFENIKSYKDSADKIILCQKKAESIYLSAKLAADAECRSRAKRKRALFLVLRTIPAVLCAAVLLASAAVHLINPAIQYNKASNMIDNQQYFDAYSVLSRLDFKDSRQLAALIKPAMYAETLPNCSIGDTVFLGSYEQDGNTENGTEPISFIVLDRTEDKLFLLSELLIDAKPYHNIPIFTSWEECDLRSWLNNEFFNTAFDSIESELIEKVKTVNADNESYQIHGGNDCEDKIFLLSINEAKNYLSENDVSLTAPTEFAKTKDITLESSWWLRTVGGYKFCASSFFDGYINYYGEEVDAICGVRPAMWISIK